MNNRNPAAYPTVEKADDQQQAVIPVNWLERERDYAVAELAMKANDGKEPASWRREFLDLSTHLCQDPENRRILQQSMIKNTLEPEEKKNLKGVLYDMNQDARERFDRLDAAGMDTSAGRLNFQRCLDETWGEKLGVGKYRKLMNEDASSTTQTTDAGQTTDARQTSHSTEAIGTNSLVERVEANRRRSKLIHELGEGIEYTGHQELQEQLQDRWNRFDRSFPAERFDGDLREDKTTNQIYTFKVACIYGQSNQDLADPENLGPMNYLPKDAQLYRPDERNSERAHLSGMYRATLTETIEQFKSYGGPVDSVLVNEATRLADRATEYARHFLGKGMANHPERAYWGDTMPAVQANDSPETNWERLKKLSKGFTSTRELREELENHRGTTERDLSLELRAVELPERTAELRERTDSAHATGAADMVSKREALEALDRLDDAMRIGTASKDGWKQVMDHMTHADMAHRIHYGAFEDAEEVVADLEKNAKREEREKTLGGRILNRIGQ